MNTTTHGTNGWRVRSAALLGAAIIAAAGVPAAIAQNADEQTADLSGSYSQPLGKKARGGQSGTTMMMSESSGGDTYTLRIDGDDVTAQVNGKKVPQDRVRRTGDTVEVLGKDGSVVHTFQISGMGGKTVGVWSGSPRAPQPPVPPDAPPPPAEMDMAPPPVMLGLLMNDSEDAGGIEVVEVFPGMPAARGGLEKGDLIIKLDGNAVESSMDLREIIVKKSGGDTLDVVVKRGQDKKNLTIKLVAYDQEAMAAARAKATGEATVPGWQLPGLSGAMRSDDDWSAHARKAMEKALAQLNSNEGFNSDKWKAELQKSLEQALAGIEKASGDMRIRVQEWGGDGEGQNRVFVMPRGSTSQWNRAGDANEKLDRLSEQLERLNKRLADMEKKLAEHKQP